jgi:hypothetical protein
VEAWVRPAVKSSNLIRCGHLKVIEVFGGPVGAACGCGGRAALCGFSPAACRPFPVTIEGGKLICCHGWPAYRRGPPPLYSQGKRR